MKRSISIFIVLLFLQCVSRAQNVEFYFESYPDSITYLGYHLGDKKFVADTLPVENNRLLIENTTQYNQGLYFLYSPKFYLEFVLDHKTATFRVSSKGYREMQIEGSTENILLRDFQITDSQLQKNQRELWEAIQSSSGEDSIARRDQFEETVTSRSALRRGIIEKNPQTFMASFLALIDDVDMSGLDPNATETDRYVYYKRQYWKGVDLGDPRLLRTPVLHGKTLNYFNKVVLQHPDSINAEINWFFSQIPDEEESFRYWLTTLFKQYAETNIMGMDAVMIHLIENYWLAGKATWITDDYRKKLQEEVYYIKPNLIGNQAPVLNAVDTLMRPVPISKMKDPYLVLFLYDPDCGHCKKAVKVLKEEYDGLKKLGAEVVAVATTTEVDEWKKFIRDRDLQWINLGDPQGRSNFRAAYNVRTTPKVYVLNKDRTIIAKNLGIDQLAEYITRYDKIEGSN